MSEDKGGNIDYIYTCNSFFLDEPSIQVYTCNRTLFKPLENQTRNFCRAKTLTGSASLVAGCLIRCKNN